MKQENELQKLSQDLELSHQFFNGIAEGEKAPLGVYFEVAELTREVFNMVLSDDVNVEDLNDKVQTAAERIIQKIDNKEANH